MSILVFGKNGQVATELGKAARVKALGREDADLSNPESGYAAIMKNKPSVVINAAAYTAVDKAEHEPELAGLINTQAPAHMAKACAELDTPLVHISTDYVFDGTGETPWRVGDLIAPLGVYGATKAAGEVAIRETGCSHVILRTSWVFSPHGGNFVKTMLRLATERSDLRIVDDQIGGPTDAASIARACLDVAEALKSDQAASGTYHFSGAPDVSWADFAREIFRQIGKDVEVEGIPTSEFPTDATRPTNSRLDCSAIQTDFGIKRPDWRVSLQTTLQELGAL